MGFPVSYGISVELCAPPFSLFVLHPLPAPPPPRRRKRMTPPRPPTVTSLFRTTMSGQRSDPSCQCVSFGVTGRQAPTSGPQVSSLVERARGSLCRDCLARARAGGPGFPLLAPPLAEVHGSVLQAHWKLEQMWGVQFILLSPTHVCLTGPFLVQPSQGPVTQLSFSPLLRASLGSLSVHHFKTFQVGKH